VRVFEKRNKEKRKGKLHRLLRAGEGAFDSTGTTRAGSRAADHRCYAGDPELPITVASPATHEPSLLHRRSADLLPELQPETGAPPPSRSA